MRHGTRYAYRLGGCRCAECKQWRRRYAAVERAHARARAGTTADTARETHSD